MAKITCGKCGAEFKFEVAKNFESCPVCGASFDDEEENVDAEDRSDWITWYYYGLKDKKGNKTEITSLEEKPIDLQKDGDIFYLIKEFQAPPRDINGKSDAAKKELRKYVPDAFAPPKETPIRCPRCGGTEYTMMNRGFSIWTGFLGSGKAKRVCNRCKREF